MARKYHHYKLRERDSGRNFLIKYVLVTLMTLVLWCFSIFLKEPQIFILYKTIQNRTWINMQVSFKT